MSSRRLLVSLVCLAGPAFAQGTFVVPSKASVGAPGAVWSDAAVQPHVLYASTGPANATRIQYLYDVADIPLVTGTLTSLEMRPPHDQHNSMSASFTTTIILSVGPNTSSTISPTFAANHGVNVASVFSGSINAPAFFQQGWPQSWFAPVVFQQPWLYHQALGSSLVVEFLTTSSTATRFTALEGYRIEGGTIDFEYFDTDCLNSAGQQAGGLGWFPQGLIPGGVVTLDWSNAPPSTPTYAANVVLWSASGVGSTFGALPVPFTLASVGLPAPAGCEIAVGDPLTTSVGDYRDFGSSFASLSVRNVPIPQTNAVIGLQLFTQPVGVDLVQGNVSLFPLQAVRWTIGSGARVPGSHVQAVFDPNAPMPQSGVVIDSEALSLRFTF